MLNEIAPQLGEYELFLFISPDQRCLYGLDNISPLGRLRQVWLAEFGDFDRKQPRDILNVDSAAIDRYWRNLEALEEWLSSQAVEINRSVYHMNMLEAFDEHLGSPSPFERPLVVDISCAPRGHLLALLNYLIRCQIANNLHVVLMYSLVKRHAPSEDAFSYGIQDVVAVPGFNGQIRSKPDILILILGFEGNRAYALYRRLMPSNSYFILGDSGDEEKEFYIERARLNNQGLLSIPGNKEYQMPSRDPLAFANSLRHLLDQEIKPLSERFNIYLSCLGTKAQTVGAFLALQSHPYIQVVDSLPSRRRIASEGRRETVFADFGNLGFLNLIPDPMVNSR